MFVVVSVGTTLTDLISLYLFVPSTGAGVGLGVSPGALTFFFLVAAQHPACARRTIPSENRRPIEPVHHTRYFPDTRHPAGRAKPQPTVMADNLGVPSLKYLVISSITGRKHIDTDTLIALYSYLENYEGVLPDASVRTTVSAQLHSRLSLILSSYDPTSLESVLGRPALERLQAADAALRKEARDFRTNVSAGAVVERRKSTVDFETGGEFYPLDALLRGAEFPKGVDPKNREKYLTDDHFLTTFGMRREDFAKKDKIMRRRLKEEKGLF